MANKHTPGPWKVFNAWQNGDAVNFSRIGNKYETIIVVQNSDDITAFNEADLHLIAAAPEMLEALQTALDWLDNAPFDYSNGVEAQGVDEGEYYGKRGHMKVTSELRAAIAKAKGEQ